MKIEQLDLTSYYEQFAYVPQKTAIFAGTIAENVAMFQPIDEAKIVQALGAAGLKNWLAGQPDKIHTHLQTASLSGGEERRLDIARALYLDAKIILFDEPTTGLDHDNEALISQVIDRLTDKLVIVVTHSLNREFLSVFDTELLLNHYTLEEVSHD